jgi:hypothetical protein
MTRITVTLHEDDCSFMIICRRNLLRIRNISDKIVKTILIHTLHWITFPWKLCQLWSDVEKYGTARQATDDNTTRRMRFACRINKATHTLRICNTYCFSTAITIRKRASMLCYMHIVFWSLSPQLSQCLRHADGQNLLNFLTEKRANRPTKDATCPITDWPAQQPDFPQIRVFVIWNKSYKGQYSLYIVVVNWYMMQKVCALFKTYLKWKPVTEKKIFISSLTEGGKVLQIGCKYVMV